MSEPETNLDPHEVDQFAKLAGEWWDATGPFRTLHLIGPVRLAFIRNVLIKHFPATDSIRRPLAGLTCLDVGCGGGLTAEPLSRLGAVVTAIDPAPENIEAARLHAAAGHHNIDYRATTAEELATTAASFDTVICLEVIEHVPDPAKFTATLAGLVRPGGMLIMSTLSRTAKSYALAIVGAEYILGWVPRGTHDWSKFITPDELERLAEEAGLTRFACEGITYDPLRDRWQLSPDTDVNYLVAFAKPELAEQSR